MKNRRTVMPPKEFTRLKYYPEDCPVAKNETDPDVIDSLLVMESDQTDPFAGYVIFAWKTEHGPFQQKFGPFYFALSAELFASERWPKAYKVWEDKRAAAFRERADAVAAEYNT